MIGLCAALMLESCAPRLINRWRRWTDGRLCGRWQVPKAEGMNTPCLFLCNASAAPHMQAGAMDVVLHHTPHAVHPEAKFMILVFEVCRTSRYDADSAPVRAPSASTGRGRPPAWMILASLADVSYRRCDGPCPAIPWFRLCNAAATATSTGLGPFESQPEPH